MCPPWHNLATASPRRGVEKQVVRPNIPDTADKVLRYNRQSPLGGSSMPIYEYRCSSCGHQNDFLQKLSEPQLTDCPECGKSTFSKQVTAAGFQLKGTGWYATDFKNKGSQSPSSDTGGSSESAPAESSAKADAPACGAGACPACN
jgi:putative FmdB family regulatory protein